MASFKSTGFSVRGLFTPPPSKANVGGDCGAMLVMADIRINGGGVMRDSNAISNDH
jgi:hypothetical protein